jgi:hypothetical protein
LPKNIILPDSVSHIPKTKKGITASRTIAWVNGIDLSAEAMFFSPIEFTLSLSRVYVMKREIINRLMKTEILLKPMSRDKRNASQVDKNVPTMMAKENLTQRLSLNLNFSSIIKPDQIDNIRNTTEIIENITTFVLLLIYKIRIGLSQRVMIPFLK